MIDSTRSQRSRIARALPIAGIALLLLASGCGESAPTDPRISADVDRSSSGALESLTVTGKGFSPNGPVRVTVSMAASGPNASPYVEEDIQADGDGKIRYEKRPLACPQATGYAQGFWTLVTTRDMTSGISGSAKLDPGREPDCRES